MSERQDALSEEAIGLAAAYPGDALEKLWWWPDEPTWYGNLRGEFRDRFLSA